MKYVLVRKDELRQDKLAIRFAYDDMMSKKSNTKILYNFILNNKTKKEKGASRE